MQKKYLAALVPILLAGCEPYVALSPQQENLNETTPYTSHTGEHNAVVESSVPASTATEGHEGVQGTGGDLQPPVEVSGEGSDPTPGGVGLEGPDLPGITEGQQAPEISGFNASHGLLTLGGECYVFGHSLGDAQSRFFRECPDHALFDTDPIGNGVWVSASFRIGNNSPAQRPAVPAPDPVVPASPEGVVTPPNTDIVIVGAPEPELPTAPVRPSEPTPTNPTGVVVLEPELAAHGRWAVSADGKSVKWSGGNYFKTPGQDIMVMNFRTREAGRYELGGRVMPGQTPARNDLENDVWIRVVGQTEWVKFFQSKRPGWVTGLTYDDPTRHPEKGVLQLDLPAGNHVVEISGRSSEFAIDNITFTKVGGSKPASVSGQPIIVLEYDAGPRDPDDLFAAMAARIVFEKLGSKPDMVVWGTLGHSFGDNIVAGSLAHAKRVFPDVIDARSDMAKVLSKYRVLLSTGRPLFIAAGGPMDITASVLTTLAGEGYDTKAITVVQHSDWNEAQTKSANFATVKALATYRRIEDGNIHNATADLRGGLGESGCRAWIDNNPYPSILAQASANLVPGHASKPCDFSDTVELLNIIGDTSTETIADFVRRYF